MKLVKIRFTSWTEQCGVPHLAPSQRQLDYWNTRVAVLSSAAEDIVAQQVHADSEVLQNTLAGITEALHNIATARTAFLCAERISEASKHPRVGTLGYQVCNDAGTDVRRVIDEAGIDLPETAVFSYEIVED